MARHALRRRISGIWRRAMATLAVAGLLTAGVVAIGEAPASAVPGTITGTVFRDFNSNGQKDTAGGLGVAIDVGIAGVTVTGYDRDGVAVGSTTTAASGDYSLSVSPTETNDVRIEFTTLPAGYETSFRGSSGTQNGGQVQFVQVGATGVNFAANVPEEYSQSNPPIITPIQRAGLANTPTNANEPAIVAIPWSAGFSASNAQAGTFPNRTTLATTPQVGPIWGTAFQGSTNSLYAAATYKRHSGLGPGGLAQIYRITGVLGTDGNITTGTPTVSQWLNVQGKAIVGGGTVDVGTAATDAARGITTPAAPARDLDAYQKAGEIGIGAIAISADQKTLYFVNLFDRNLYSIDISDPVAAATSPIIKKISLGLGAGQRPWAVEINRGYIYVGYVDSADALVGVASASPESTYPT
jgi:SdrD B-like domain